MRIVAPHMHMHTREVHAPTWSSSGFLGEGAFEASTDASFCRADSWTLFGVGPRWARHDVGAAQVCPSRGVTRIGARGDDAGARREASAHTRAHLAVARVILHAETQDIGPAHRRARRAARCTQRRLRRRADKPQPAAPREIRACVRSRRRVRNRPRAGRGAREEGRVRAGLPPGTGTHDALVRGGERQGLRATMQAQQRQRHEPRRHRKRRPPTNPSTKCGPRTLLTAVRSSTR